ncbi:Magnesium transporter MRS2, mitochondrial [Merluccius polli]|uniref:Magnesium transporter MRS2, mitochondrial n=1 Tax=Merluccius polli TaxID=89951 RepID=A0AA47MGJ4_MERPO|nr:Magnesium transporter MRS2, mitochondrial [Merluccius polli]
MWRLRSLGSPALLKVKSVDSTVIDRNFLNLLFKCGVWVKGIHSEDEVELAVIWDQTAPASFRLTIPRKLRSCISTSSAAPSRDTRGRSTEPRTDVRHGTSLRHTTTNRVVAARCIVGVGLMLSSPLLLLPSWRRLDSHRPGGTVRSVPVGTVSLHHLGLPAPDPFDPRAAAAGRPSAAGMAVCARARDCAGVVRRAGAALRLNGETSRHRSRCPPEQWIKDRETGRSVTYRCVRATSGHAPLFHANSPFGTASPVLRCHPPGPRPGAFGKETLLGGNPRWSVSFVRHRATDAPPLSTVAPTFVVMKFDKEGNVTSFEKKKTELCQELSLQARDLRFQHSTSLTARNNCIIIRMEMHIPSSHIPLPLHTGAPGRSRHRSSPGDGGCGSLLRLPSQWLPVVRMTDWTTPGLSVSCTTVARTGLSSCVLQGVSSHQPAFISDGQQSPFRVVDVSTTACHEQLIFSVAAGPGDVRLVAPRTLWPRLDTFVTTLFARASSLVGPVGADKTQ